MLGCFQKNTSKLSAVTLLGAAHLASSHADKLKYAHTDAFGYNKCKLVSIPEAALMNKSMYGEKKA
jgi:hypothetical protein